MAPVFQGVAAGPKSPPSLLFRRVGGAWAAVLLLARLATAQLPSGFAGTEACRACHEQQFAAWAESTHGTAGGVPSPEMVIAPFDGRPLRFADAVVVPRVDDEGRYLFVVERAGRPPLQFEVAGVVGMGHMVGGGTQGFVTRSADGTFRFLPFDYSKEAGTWFCNTAFVGGFWVPGAERAQLRADAGWQPVDEEMRLTECGDWPPARVLGTNRRFANCQNCHGSQIELEYKPQADRYETRVASFQINCESCHGPAAEHLARARSGALVSSANVGLAALDTLGTDASLRVCFQCHALKRALGDGTGVVRDTAYSLGLPLIGDRPYLPDGRIRTFGYQQPHRSSACYLSGEMTCTDCHDPHSQGYRDPFRSPLTGRFDDRQCTVCHASKAADPERHTFHPAGTPGSGCVSCHMPYRQHPELSDAIPYARADHSIAIPRPGYDGRLGLVSACAGCHQDRPEAELTRLASERWGETKPLRPEVAALNAALAGEDPDAGERALLAAAARGERYGLAKLMALDVWVRGLPVLSEGRSPGWAGQAEEGLADRVGRALAAMSADEDPDVRAAAAAALQVTRGSNPDVRALLDALLREADAGGLRVRWAASLLQWADAAGRLRGSAAALPYLRRAQEVRPDAPETLLALASGLAATGEIDEAVQTYLEALRRAPDNAVALVNLGLGLELLGRGADAEAVYERAVQVRPTEALAHFNLGNARFRRADYESAIRAYGAAVLYDPGLARAHFYLAVALVNTGRAAEALPFLYNAQEFAPDDEEIQDVIRRVEDAVRRGAEPA